MIIGLGIIGWLGYHKTWNMESAMCNGQMFKGDKIKHGDFVTFNSGDCSCLPHGHAQTRECSIGIVHRRHVQKNLIIMNL